MKQTALHLASLNGHLEIVPYLIEKGADVNVKDRWQQTPLHLASEKGHLEVVQCLTEKGADINVKDDNGQTALHFASEQNMQEAVRCFPDDEAKKLFQASRKEVEKFLTSISK